MCLVRVFIFVKKAEQMYEITIFKSAMHREERRDEMRVQRGEETEIKKKLIRWVRAQSKKVDKCFSPSVYCLKSAPATFQNILFKHGFWSNNFQTTLFWTPWPNIFFQILDTSVQCLNTEHCVLKRQTKQPLNHLTSSTITMRTQPSHDSAKTPHWRHQNHLTSGTKTITVFPPPPP